MKQPLLMRIATSTFLLTALLLLGFDYALTVFNPLKRVNDLGLSGLNYYYVVAKLPQFMGSSDKADVVLTGSSLWLYPSVRTEDDFAGVQTRYDPTYVCQRIDGCATSRYFESLLPGHSVANLGVAAALMSDQYTVLKRLVGTGKKPSLLICDLSPREFLDNNQPDPTKTPVYLVLSDMTGIGDVLSMGRDFAGTCDYVFGAVSNCFRSRRDLRLSLVNFVAGFSSKKMDLATISNPAVISVYTPTAGMFEKDLEHYRKMYLPVNRKSLDTQLDYLRKYLELAKKEDIPVLCVWFPLTEANLALLPKKDLDELTSRANELATNYGATVYRPAEQFANDDFEDTAHMNAKGGRKFFNGLANATAPLLARGQR